MRFVPGEVKISSRIKLHPPLPGSRDFLPSGGRFEISSVAKSVDGKNFPLSRETFRSGGKKLRSCSVSLEQEWSMSQ